MKVEFRGAAQTVTGSCHLVHYRGQKLVLDCGLFQGHRKEAFETNRKLPFDPRSVDAVVLSHAHIDHCGNLPSMVKSGYRGPIYASDCTRDLVVHMLFDSANIQESDVRYINKQRRRTGQTPFEPLYEKQDVVHTVRQLRPREFGEFFKVLPGVTCRYWYAGHMIGAAITELLFETENGQSVRLVFSGDLGRLQTPILRDPEIVPGADYLIMEATYGDRLHEATVDTDEALGEAAFSAFRAGGRLIIPAFSVGRTQEIVYRLNRLFESGKLPPMQVFVDSPLAVDASEVFREHVGCLNDEFTRQLLSEEDQDPFGFRDLHYVRKPAMSKELNRFRQPCIIISASGMCEGGRILHHLKHGIGNPANVILFAGYQAPNTLGRKILDGMERVNILGESYEVHARVMKLEGASGHADQEGLLEWAVAMKEAGEIRKVALVHCELGPATAFRERLLSAGFPEVLIPAPGHVMEMV